MNWQPNPGKRPPGLADSAKVHVRLNNGSEYYWTVQNNAEHKIIWTIDPDFPFAIKDWCRG